MSGSGAILNANEVLGDDARRAIGRRRSSGRARARRLCVRFRCGDARERRARAARHDRSGRFSAVRPCATRHALRSLPRGLTANEGRVATLFVKLMIYIARAFQPGAPALSQLAVATRVDTAGWAIVLPRDRSERRSGGRSGRHARRRYRPVSRDRSLDRRHHHVRPRRRSLDSDQRGRPRIRRTCRSASPRSRRPRSRSARAPASWSSTTTSSSRPRSAGCCRGTTTWSSSIRRPRRCSGSLRESSSRPSSVTSRCLE